MYGDFCVAAAHSSCLLLPVVTLGARRRPPHYYSNNMDETREKQHTGAPSIRFNRFEGWSIEESWEFMKNEYSTEYCFYQVGKRRCGSF